MHKNIIMRYCPYCQKYFGCIIGSISRECATCDVKYASEDCYKGFAGNISHGICTKECLLTAIRFTEPRLAEHIENALLICK